MNNEMESNKWQKIISQEYEQDPMYKKKKLSQHTSFHDLTYKFNVRTIKWRTPSFTIKVKILETIKNFSLEVNLRCEKRYRNYHTFQLICHINLDKLTLI
jgi:hypothetical protein